MAAPNIAKKLRYKNADLNGSFSDGAVFDITGPTKPIVQGIITDPDGGSEPTAAQVRFYTWSGKYLFYRSLSQVGTEGGEKLWEYQTVYNSGSVNTKNTITVQSGTATGGFIRIWFNELQSEDIPWVGITNAKLQAAMERHPDVGVGNVLVTSATVSGKLTYTFEWINQFAKLKLTNGFAVNNQTAGNLVLTAGTSASGTSDFSKSQVLYLWDMVGWDGSRFSGNIGLRRTAIGPSRMSLWTDFPTTISATVPTYGATLDTPTPTVSWTFTGGTIGDIKIARQVDRFFDTTDPTNETIVVDTSGSSAASKVSTTIPSATPLLNGHSYYWDHRIWKESGAYSNTVRVFDVVFPRPTANLPTVTWNVNPDKAYVWGTWTATAMSDANFIEYVVKVRPQGEPETSLKNVEIWTNSTKATTSGYFSRIPKNTPVTLAFYVRQYQYGAPVLSTAREYNVTLNIYSAMIIQPANLTYVMLDAHLGVEVGYVQEPKFIQNWKRTAPTPIYGGPRSRVAQLTAKLMGTVAQQNATYAKLESLHQNSNRYPLVYSDANGDVLNCVMGPPSKLTPGLGQAIQVGLTFTEVTVKV